MEDLQIRADRLEYENKILKSKNEQLKIELEGEKKISELYKNFIHETRPAGSIVLELPRTNNDDLKDINI